MTDSEFYSSINKYLDVYYIYILIYFISELMKSLSLFSYISLFLYRILWNHKINWSFMIFFSFFYHTIYDWIKGGMCVLAEYSFISIVWLSQVKSDGVGPGDKRSRDSGTGFGSPWDNCPFFKHRKKKVLPEVLSKLRVTYRIWVGALLPNHKRFAKKEQNTCYMLLSNGFQHTVPCFSSNLASSVKYILRRISREPKLNGVEY